MVYTGRSTVPLVDTDELGRKRVSSLRKITILVDATGRVDQPLHRSP